MGCFTFIGCACDQKEQDSVVDPDPFMVLDPPDPDPSLFCMDPDFLSLKKDVNVLVLQKELSKKTYFLLAS